MSHPNEPVQSHIGQSHEGPQFQQPQGQFAPGSQSNLGQQPHGPANFPPSPYQPAPQPQKKRRWFLSWPVVAPVAFLLGLLIGASGGEAESAGSAPPPSETVATAGAPSAEQAESAEDPDPTEGSDPETKPEKESADQVGAEPAQESGADASPRLGETVTTESGNTITITAESMQAGEWDDSASDGTYLLVTVKLTNHQGQSLEPFMEVEVASGDDGEVADEAYVDDVNGSWYSDVIPAGKTRTFDAAFVVSKKQAKDLQVTLTWDYDTAVTFVGAANG